MRSKIGDILDEVWTELESATSNFPPMNSYHEGYAVLKEEVDEMWDEIKKKQPQDSTRVRAEAIQVAAMACRLILDCCDENNDGGTLK